MKFLKAFFVVVWFSCTLAQSQMVPAQACLRLAGMVIDYASKKPLHQARLLAKLPTGYSTTGADTDESGSFILSVPCAATAVVIEKQGYRSQLVALNKLVLTQETDIYVSIPLISVDPLANNKPYSQSEQTDYVQESTSSKERGLKVIQRGLYTIKDAIRHNPLQATACFFFTKSKGKKCVQTNTQGQFNFDFVEADIVAIEVRAKGYQPYTANLIVDQLDGRLLRHEIRLQRELTLLAVRLDKGTRCELRSGSKRIPLYEVPRQPGWFSTYDLVAKRYDLITESQGQTTQEPILINAGLNYKVVNQKAKVGSTDYGKQIVSKAVSNGIETYVSTVAALTLPDTIPPIYFEQSSYTLRADSQEVLRRVASFLKQHPNYQLQIFGHTDNVGNQRLNQSLSEFRANVTATFLSRQGIATGRLTKVGFGSQYPISPNDTEENKARNRRVSLKLISNL